MNFTETISNFQIKASRIEKLEINNDFIGLKNTENLDTNIKIGNAISQVQKDESDGLLYASLKLDLTVTSSEKNSKKKYCIHMLTEGLFTFDSNDEEEFKQMLLLNGNSTLYSIARSHIMTFSSLSLSGGSIILPMINFYKLLKLQSEKKENIKE